MIIRKVTALVLASTVLAAQAWAGGSCVRPEDDMAMKTSAMQQYLMVAALSCGEVSLYNRFVLAHQGELQKADATLLSFFQRENGESGEASYHTFKTQAANVSSLESAHNRDGYCVDAEQLFGVALDSYGANLDWVVATQWKATDEFIHTSCLVEAQTAQEPAASRPYESPVPPPPPEPTMAN